MMTHNPLSSYHLVLVDDAHTLKVKSNSVPIALLFFICEEAHLHTIKQFDLQAETPPQSDGCGCLTLNQIISNKGIQRVF